MKTSLKESSNWLVEYSLHKRTGRIDILSAKWYTRCPIAELDNAAARQRTAKQPNSYIQFVVNLSVFPQFQET